jgi:diamine N-acetyltransferase
MTVPSVTIHRAGHGDLQSLAALAGQTFREAYAATNPEDDLEAYIEDHFNAAALATALADARNAFFVARVDGSLAGYANLRAGVVPAPLAGTSAIEIQRIYVSGEHYGRKVGAALMGHLLDEARTTGHDVIWLGVWQENARAIRFYEQWGFEACGSDTFQLGDNLQVDWLMRKAL